MKPYSVKNHLIRKAEMSATGATIHDIKGLIGRYKQFVKNYNFWITLDDKEAIEEAKTNKLFIEKCESDFALLDQK